MRTVSTLLAAGVVALAPAAFADSSKEITVSLEYDSSLLSSEAGAAQVLASLESQVDRACLRERSLIVTERIDEACATDLLAKAVAEIHNNEADAAVPLAGIFAAEPAMVLAALEQR
ncbi:MAG: UrcA family protein [Pseudomonadota bacterium]